MHSDYRRVEPERARRFRPGVAERPASKCVMRTGEADRLVCSPSRGHEMDAGAR